MPKPSAKMDTSAAADDLGILARRKIEAAIIAPIYDEMRAAFGEERARNRGRPGQDGFRVTAAAWSRSFGAEHALSLHLGRSFAFQIAPVSLSARRRIRRRRLASL